MSTSCMAVVVHFPSPGSELFSNIGWRDVGNLSMVLLEYYGCIWKQESLQKVCGASFISNLQWHRGPPSYITIPWLYESESAAWGERLLDWDWGKLHATAQRYTVISFWILGGTSCLVWHLLMTCHWLRRDLDEPNMLPRPCTARITHLLLAFCCWGSQGWTFLLLFLLLIFPLMSKLPLISGK